MSSPPNKAADARTGMIYSAEEWLNLKLTTDESQVVIGTPQQAIIRVGTKNVVEAPEKSFKTTFMLRLALGLSAGQTVFPQLPIPRKRKVLYVHGELSPPEIQERTLAACVQIPRPIHDLIECRDIEMHFKEKKGQGLISEIIGERKPQDVVFDPWQSFISGLDENLFKDISPALRFIDGLIAKFDVTIHLVTHVGKDRTKGTRGHSCIAGWRDTLIKLERVKSLSSVKVTVEPRWAAPIKPFQLKFADGTLWPDSQSDTSFTGQTAQIRHFVESNGGTVKKDSIRGDMNFKSQDACRKALERAAGAGAILIQGDVISIPTQLNSGAADRTTP